MRVVWFVKISVLRQRKAITAIMPPSRFGPLCAPGLPDMRQEQHAVRSVLWLVSRKGTTGSVELCTYACRKVTQTPRPTRGSANT
jgi:hypothetical protein